MTCRLSATLKFDEGRERRVSLGRVLLEACHKDLKQLFSSWAVEFNAWSLMLGRRAKSVPKGAIEFDDCGLNLTELTLKWLEERKEKNQNRIENGVDGRSRRRKGYFLFVLHLSLGPSPSNLDYGSSSSPSRRSLSSLLQVHNNLRHSKCLFS